ncbi:MAG: ribonuclease HI [Acidobacteriota bacterium]
MPASHTKPEVQIYTDGAAKGNPGLSGYGAVLIFGEHRKELSGGFRWSTNNRMELMATIVGLEALKKACRVELFSDSKYVVDAVEKRSVFRWQARNWWRTRDEKAKNVDLWQRFLAAYGKHEVRLQWVKGHAGHEENERCDDLAVGAALGENLEIDAPYEELNPWTGGA